MSANRKSGSVSTGLFIAFFGPDGVGKSAIIEQLKVAAGTDFSAVVQFHFRPMLGRQAPHRSPVSDPHAQAPRSLLVSCAKLLYWLLDCWYGYFVAVRPARRCSGLVIFDRYYPDILVDPLRYRLPAGSLRFATWLAAFAPRPDLCVLLDAPADVVQRRKQEVSPAESQRQRIAYLALFHSMPSTLLVSADDSVDQVSRQVSAAISTFLHEPFMQPYEVLLFADF
jgi:thymidylate kinase